MSVSTTPDAAGVGDCRVVAAMREPYRNWGPAENVADPEMFRGEGGPPSPAESPRRGVLQRPAYAHRVADAVAREFYLAGPYARDQSIGDGGEARGLDIDGVNGE